MDDKWVMCRGNNDGGRRQLACVARGSAAGLPSGYAALLTAALPWLRSRARVRWPRSSPADIDDIVPETLLALRIDTNIACSPAIAADGIVPAAAAAAFSLRLFHGADSFTTLLVRQMGNVALFTFGGSAIGRTVPVRLSPRRSAVTTASQRP